MYISLVYQLIVVYFFSDGILDMKDDDDSDLVIDTQQ